MPLTNSLKPLLDIPTWEWCRFAPAAWDANRPLTTAGDGLSRYIYGPNFATNMFAYRYDTQSDAWQQMAQAFSTGQSTTAAQYTRHVGYAFRPISSGASTVTGALLDGERLKGATIRVLEGTGDGQERTITGVADPVIVQRGYATATNQNATQVSWIRDTNKNWTINQWVGYQMRIYLNSGAGVLRRILYNDANTLYYFDPTWSAHSPYEWGTAILQTLSVTAGSQSAYTIESSVATINTPWTVQPDRTSMIMCETGAMWVASGTGTSSPFFSFQYYDIAADAWNAQVAQAGVTFANLAESTLERIGDWGSPFATGTATGSSTTTALVAGGSPAWATDRWANYRVRITAGTGMGQSRMIASNTADALTVSRPFITAPNATSTFEIVGDVDKLYLQTNGDVRLKQYSIRAQQWINSRLYDFGVVRTLSATRGSVENPLEGYPVTSISRSGTTATVTTGINHNLVTGDTVTIAGATGADAALFNGSFTITVTGITTFTYTMSGTPVGATATFNALSTTILVDATKSWTTNELVGKSLQWASGSGFQSNLGGMAVITANTANTITVATVSTLPVNGQSYAITDGPAFGFDNFTGSASTNGTGVATGGSTSTIVDSTKTWATNEHVGKTVMITAGAGWNQGSVITANTANTLTFSVLGVAIAANARYSILPTQNRGSGLQLKWVAYPTNTEMAGRYMFSFRGGNTLQVDRYDIATQQWKPVSLQLSELINTGSMYAYDGVDRIYIHINATNKIAYMDVDTLKVDLYSQAPYAQGTAAAGQRMEIVSTSDGLKFLYLTRHGGTEMWRTLLFL